MSIFLDIKNRNDEDITTEILVCALTGSPALCEKFQELTGLTGEIKKNKTQFADTQDRSRPDICVQTTDSILFVENKPWDGSKLTSGETGQPDQLSRYADELCQEEIKNNFPNRILCLLTKGYIKERLLKDVANCENVNVSSNDLRPLEEILKEHFDKNKKIKFVVLTWERLLDSLKSVETDDAAKYKLILDSLEEDIISPPELTKIKPTIDSFREHYGTLRRLANQAIDIVHSNQDVAIRFADSKLIPDRNPNWNPSWKRSSDSSCWFGVFEEVYPWGTFQWGPNVDDYKRLSDLKIDELPNHPFTFNVIFGNKDHRWGIEAYKRRKIRTPIFDFDHHDTKDAARKFFKELHFYEYEGDWATIFIKPFDFEGKKLSNLSPEIIADCVIKFAKEYTEACERFIGLK